VSWASLETSPRYIEDKSFTPISVTRRCIAASNPRKRRIARPTLVLGGPNKMKEANLSPGYETVFSVMDYSGWPRKGIENYQGTPHLYEWVSNGAKDPDPKLFRLMPLSAEIFRLAMEDWEIWRRWLVASYEQKTDISTRPALPSDTTRHVELKRILDEALIFDSRKAVMRVGQFEVLAEPSFPERVIRQLQVKWIQPI
jgi:hypothetical protein